MFFKAKSPSSLGSGGGSGLLDEKHMDRRISKSMTLAERQNKRICKLLILGGGGSGKTTLRKQVSNLYSEGFKDPLVRLGCKETIYHNLIEGVKQTLIGVRALDLEVDSECAQAIQLLSELEEDFDFTGPRLDSVVSALRLTHSHAAVQLVLGEHRSQFQIQECVVVYWKQFAQNYPEWGGAEAWIPSTDDCIRSRIRSSGIVEVEFTHEHQTFKLFDAGGQRAERRKWLHAFDGVTALIFMVSLTEYDEVLFEDTNRNRLEESLEVWDGLVNTSHFADVPVLLFLNKLDLFEETYFKKRAGLNATGLFPGAPPPDAPIAVAIDWIAQEFRQRLRKPNAAMHVHTLSAVDGGNVDQVFKAVREICAARSSEGM